MDTLSKFRVFCEMRELKAIQKRPERRSLFLEDYEWQNLIRLDQLSLPVQGMVGMMGCA